MCSACMNAWKLKASLTASGAASQGDHENYMDHLRNMMFSKSLYVSSTSTLVEGYLCFYVSAFSRKK